MTIDIGGDIIVQLLKLVFVVVHLGYALSTPLKIFQCILAVMYMDVRWWFWVCTAIRT